MKWNVDQMHTRVGFAVTHMGFFTVRGGFTEMSGSVETSAEGVPQRIEMDVNMRSLSTGNETRDQHLHSPDFFDSGAHPVMHFASSNIQPVRSSGGFLSLFRRAAPTLPRYAAQGLLTLRGQSHPLLLDFEIKNSPFVDTFEATRLGATCTGRLDRTLWGMNWQQTVPSVAAAVVSNVVVLEIDLQVTQA